MGLELKIGVETNSLETIRMLVSVGLGWSVLPLESMLQEGLVCRPLPGVRFFRELGLVTRRNRNLCRAAQASARCCRARPRCGVGTPGAGPTARPQKSAVGSRGGGRRGAPTVGC